MIVFLWELLRHFRLKVSMKRCQKHSPATSWRVADKRQASWRQPKADESQAPKSVVEESSLVNLVGHDKEIVDKRSQGREEEQEEQKRCAFSGV